MRRAAVAAAAALVACGPRPRPAAVAPAPAPAKVAELNHGGAAVDVAAALPAGYVTVVDFWATWCGGCKVAEARFMARLGAEPGVVVRKVDVGDGDTPAARAYGVRGLPQVWVYDGARRLRYVLVANDAMRTADVALALVAEARGGAPAPTTLPPPAPEAPAPAPAPAPTPAPVTTR